MKLFKHLFVPKHVAEVWLVWPICRGSTLYRGAFAYQWLAYLVVRWKAFRLDMVLPSHWLDRNWEGQLYAVSYDYGIHYGVRQPTPQEASEGVRHIWSPHLPGHRDSSSEHAECHPLLKNADKDCEALGFKV